jgi:hypothetical protein
MPNYKPQDKKSGFLQISRLELHEGRFENLYRAWLILGWRDLASKVRKKAIFKCATMSHEAKLILIWSAVIAVFSQIIGSLVIDILKLAKIWP